MIPWTFVTILCILRSAQAWVDQPDKVITVALGNTVTLRCYSPIWRISGIIQSDEAVYYCASKASYIEFGSGTHLIIKGQQHSTSKISKSDHLNDSIECQQKVNNEDISEERLWLTVLGLACALGLCGVVIFALVGFIFKRVQGSGQVRRQSGAQDTDDENLTYAALRFSQKKIKSGGQREKSQQSVNIIYDSLNVQ